MPSAYALGIFSGIIILILRLSRSAERDKRVFTSGVAEVNCICRTVFGLVNLFYQFFRFYNSSVLYYNEVATLLLKSTGGCFLDS